jgi:hypothetical protein
MSFSVGSSSWEQFLDCAVRPQLVSELQVSPGHHTSGTETPRPITAQVNTSAPPHPLAKLATQAMDAVGQIVANYGLVG